MAILSGAFEAIEALERDGLVRVWTDLGVVCAVITGSLPTADAAFDPERNSLELVLRLGDDIRYALTDTVPTIITDEDLTKLRVDNVMDLEEERPMNLIHGKHVFRVAGFNMVLGDEDAAVYLENSMGTTFPLTVDEVVSKQLFKAHTTELLEAGDYKLVVKSRAGDAAGPLQTSFRRVKYLRVEDPQPTITRAGTRGDGDGFVNATGTLDVVGENLETATEIQLLRDSGELWQSVPATYFEGALTAVLDLPAPPCANGMVRVSTLGGSATYEVAYGDH